MSKLELYDTEIGQKLQDHLYRLSTIIQSFDLFKYCLEEEIYVNTRVELISFAKIILAYTRQMKKDFTDIGEELNIL